MKDQDTSKRTEELRKAILNLNNLRNEPGYVPLLREPEIEQILVDLKEKQVVVTLKIS